MFLSLVPASALLHSVSMKNSPGPIIFSSRFIPISGLTGLSHSPCVPVLHFVFWAVFAVPTKKTLVLLAPPYILRSLPFLGLTSSYHPLQWADKSRWAPPLFSGMISHYWAVSPCLVSCTSCPKVSNSIGTPFFLTCKSPIHRCLLFSWEHAPFSSSSTLPLSGNRSHRHSLLPNSVGKSLLLISLLPSYGQLLRVWLKSAKICQNTPTVTLAKIR